MYRRQLHLARACARAVAVPWFTPFASQALLMLLQPAQPTLAPPAPVAEPMPADDLALLETIAKLQAHLDALQLTNSCLNTQLENAKSGAVEMEQCASGRAREGGDEQRPTRRARRGRDDDIADNGDFDEPLMAMHRGFNATNDSLASSALTEVNDDPAPLYRSSSGAMADAEFDGVPFSPDDDDLDCPRVQYRSCGGSSFGADGADADEASRAAQFDLEVLQEAVQALGTLRLAAAAPSDAAVTQQLQRLDAAMRPFRPNGM